MSLDWHDETPFRSFVRPFTEVFATGLKFAIDECLRHAEASETPHG